MPFCPWVTLTFDMEIENSMRLVDESAEHAFRLLTLSKDLEAYKKCPNLFLERETFIRALEAWTVGHFKTRDPCNPVLDARINTKLIPIYPSTHLQTRPLYEMRETSNVQGPFDETPPNLVRYAEAVNASEDVLKHAHISIASLGVYKQKLEGTMTDSTFLKHGRLSSELRDLLASDELVTLARFQVFINSLRRLLPLVQAEMIEEVDVKERVLAAGACLSEGKSVSAAVHLCEVQAMRALCVQGHTCCNWIHAA
jgi:hypothetical protein